MRRETFPASEPLTLGVWLVAGDLRVDTDDVAEATVELEGLNEAGRRAAEEARIELTGGELKVEVDRRSGFRITIGRGAEVRVVARVPHGSTLETHCVSADVTAEGSFAAATVKTVSGDVRVSAVESDAEVKSVSGDIWFGRVGGRFALNSVSGDVFVGEARRGARVKTVSGDQALDSVAEGEATLQSVSGDIRVGVVSGAAIWMDVKSLSGTTTSELEVGDEPPPGDGPRIELRANSVSGDIRIARGSGVTA